MHSPSGRIASLLAAVILVAAACGSSAPKSASPSGSLAPSGSPAPTPVATDPTSEELIAAALEAGSISYEDSLLYRTLALYNSPGLPQQFQSKVPDMHAAGELFGEIRAKRASLGAGTLEKLAPYMARPSDPTSIFNTALPVARAAGLAIGAIAPVAPAAPPAATAATAWKHNPAAGGKVQVWMQESAGDTARADRVKSVDQVWAAYPGIFTYPHRRQPQCAVGAGQSGRRPRHLLRGRGRPGPAAPGMRRRSEHGRLRLLRCGCRLRAAGRPVHGKGGRFGLRGHRRIQDGDDLLDTLAHEIAHTAQYAYDESETAWLYESTATWVAYRVMKKLGKEPTFAYKLLGQAFYGLDKTLTRLGKQTQYASWLYFLFAQMEEGDGVVIDVWNAAATPGVQGADAVNKVLPFEPKYADYALRDWNQDPVKPMYANADPTFPDGYWPAIRNSLRRLAGGKEDALKVDLPPLASAYFQYSFEDFSARRYLREQPGRRRERPCLGHRDHQGHRQAARRLDRSDQEEVLSRRRRAGPHRGRDRRHQHQHYQPVAGFTAAPRRGRRQGLQRLGRHDDRHRALGRGSAHRHDDRHPRRPVDGRRVECERMHGGSSDCVLYRPTGTITWSWDTHTKGGPVTPACDIVLAGSLAAGVVKYDDQQFLTLRKLDATHYRYFGSAWFLLPTGTEHCLNPITAAVQSNQIFSLSEGPTGGGGGDTCDPTDWQIDVKADTISGSCYAYKNENTSMYYEWHLTRVGPAPGS